MISKKQKEEYDRCDLVMGLLVQIFKDSSDSEFKLAHGLVAIAVADGIISDVKRREIEKNRH